MSVYAGKLTRNIGKKQGKEYFVGKFEIPVKAFWSKKNEEELCIFLGDEKTILVPQKKDPEVNDNPQEEGKQ